MSVNPSSGAVGHLAVGNDGLYVSASGNGLEAVGFDGSLKWRFLGSVGSTPTLADDGTIYVGSANTNYVYALNPGPNPAVDADRYLLGGIKWKFQTGGAVQSSPVIGADGTVYVGALDGYLYALNPADGSLKWRFGPGSGTRLFSPALSPDGTTLYVGATNNYLYAVNLNGTQKWRFHASGEVNNPVVGTDGTIYFTSDNYSLWAVAPSGQQKWKASLGKSTLAGTGAEPVIDTTNGPGAGTIYVQTDNLFSFTPSGTLKWKYAIGDPINSQPAIGADGTIYAHGSNGLYALTSAGKLLWTGSGSGEPAIGGDGTVYVGGAALLYAYKDGSVGRPTIYYLRPSPDPVAPGGALQLWAAGVGDVPGRTVSSVSFYQDADGDGVLNPAIDTLLGTDTNGLDYWTWNVTASLTPGTTTYFAQAVDNSGYASNVVSCTSTVASPMLAAGGPATSPTSSALASAEVQVLAGEAIRRWESVGLSMTQDAALHSIHFQIADLGGANLGMASGHTIWIDANAAGWGWFVDRTPGSDNEFTTPGNQGEQNHMDLLSVLMHEMGHLLGLEHNSASGDVMNAALNPGVRLMPTASDLLGSTLAGAPSTNRNDAGKAASGLKTGGGFSDTLGLTDAVFADLAQRADRERWK